MATYDAYGLGKALTRGSALGYSVPQPKPVLPAQYQKFNLNKASYPEQSVPVSTAIAMPLDQLRASAAMPAAPGAAPAPAPAPAPVVPAPAPAYAVPQPAMTYEQMLGTIPGQGRGKGKLEHPIAVTRNALIAGGLGATGSGMQLLKDYMAGLIPPGAEARVMEFLQNKRANLARVYAQAGLGGLGESTMGALDLADIEQEALILREGLRQMNFENALKALGVGAPLLTGAADIKLAEWQRDLQKSAQGQSFLGSIFGAASSLGQLTAGIGSLFGPVGTAAGAAVGAAGAGGGSLAGMAGGLAGQFSGGFL